MTLFHTLSALRPARILVAGDLFLDSYTFGLAKRISPEAPVPVVEIQREESRPGGAGNVILNLISLGAEVRVLGRIGEDGAGEAVSTALKQERVDISGLIVQKGYATPVKNRIIANHQQLVRLDRETISSLPSHFEEKVLFHLPAVLDEVSVIAISDYGKGFLTPRLLSALIRAANEKGIPVITDPKGNDFTRYYGTTVIKPNLSEFFAASRLPSDAPLEAGADILLKETAADLLMVTRSEAGLSLFTRIGERQDFPVQAKEVKDVTGAGDTVLATLSYAIANHLSYAQAAELCNLAASLAIEQVGCARISLSALACRLFEHHRPHKKRFFPEQLFILGEVLRQRPFVVLHLEEVRRFTPSLLQRIRELAQQGEGELLITWHPQRCEESVVEMLASLQEVSILACCETLQSLSSTFTPQLRHIFTEVSD